MNAMMGAAQHQATTASQAAPSNDTLPITVHMIATAMVANRVEYFRLIARLETIVGREASPKHGYESFIDAELSDKPALTAEDVRRLLADLFPEGG